MGAMRRQGHKRRKAFDTAAYAAYRKAQKEAWQRRMAGLVGLVMKAWRGDPEPLIDYFQHNGPFCLSEEDGEYLAWLLEEKLRRTPVAHRPRGSSTPTNKALRTAVYLLRRGKRVWCERHGRQRVSKKEPIVTNLAERALELVEQELPSKLRGKISVEDVRGFNKPIRSDEAEAFLSDVLPDAIWEMKKAALK
jgi:hypothetical protein